MRRALAFIGAAASAVVAPGVAFADVSAARACAATLPLEAKAIYDAAAPEFPTAADPRSLVRIKAMDLVRAGTVQRGSARSSAMAAGECLKKLR